MQPVGSLSYFRERLVRTRKATDEALAEVRDEKLVLRV